MKDLKELVPFKVNCLNETNYIKAEKLLYKHGIRWIYIEDYSKPYHFHTDGNIWAFQVNIDNYDNFYIDCSFANRLEDFNKYLSHIKTISINELLRYEKSLLDKLDRLEEILN